MVKQRLQSACQIPYMEETSSLSVIYLYKEVTTYPISFFLQLYSSNRFPPKMKEYSKILCESKFYHLASLITLPQAFKPWSNKPNKKATLFTFATMFNFETSSEIFRFQKEIYVPWKGSYWWTPFTGIVYQLIMLLSKEVWLLTSWSQNPQRLASS